MMARTLWSVVAAAVLVTGSAAEAQSASELLEKGIYTEETVGDLDAAIQIYRKIVEDAKANRVSAARAQYRLGHCLLKQGKKKDARAAFQEVIKDFADQKELVAKVRKEMPDAEPELKLGPVPWKDGEALHMRLKLAGGLDIGTIVWTADTANVDGRDVWRFQTYRYTTVNSSQGVSRVDADRKTFRPITSLFKHSLMGNVEAAYTPTEATITTVAKDGKKSTRTAKLDNVVYDNEQGLYLFRRLPLKVGSKITAPIYVTFGAGYIPIELDVVGKETLKVPAGSFECYKVDLGIVQQTFWFTTDENCYLVKFQAGGVSAELDSIQHRKVSEPSEYRHAKKGADDSDVLFSLTAPPGWLFYESTSPTSNCKVSVHLLDPEADASTLVRAYRTEDLKKEQEGSVRAWAESKAAETKKALKDYQVRPDSWKDRKLSGAPAIGFVADFGVGDEKMVAYSVFVLGESTALELIIKAKRDQFDEFQKQFDSIVDTCKVK